MRVQVNARNRGYDFDARPGEKLLHAGLRSGIDLPYECSTGTCGTCKATLVSGRVTDAWRDAPGKKYLKPGTAELLMCQCVAEEPVMLEVPKFVHPTDPGTCAPQANAGTLRRARRLTSDVIAFTLALDAPCDFDAGQFVLLAPEGVSGFRAYSMCNFARGARELEFLVKRKPEGRFSDWLFSAEREGARLQVFGPLGKAVFDPTLRKNILCIAGGSGLAGMMSILARAAAEGYFDRQSGWLYFGVRTLRDAFFLDELGAYARRFAGKLSVTLALSEEDVPASAQREHPDFAFARGLVHEVAKREMAGKYQGLRAYVAGPPPAVDAAIRMLLLDARLTTDNIRYDKYS
jgi:toluene monooxygenase electron transfer component